MIEILGLIGLFMTLALGLQASKSFESFTISALGKEEHVPSADELGGGVKGVARQSGTVIRGLIIVVVASLAVIVVDRFDQSLGTPQSSSLSQSQESVLDGFSGMVDLIEPLLLVIIAVVIIGVIQRLRG